MSSTTSSATLSDRGFVDDILSIKELDTDLYIAEKTWKAKMARGTFGGQIIGQALMAANNTVKPGLNLHSLHSYFLRAGDVTRPVIYQVSHTRDGQSFSSRSISAIQNGKHILTLQASYHNEDSEAPSVFEYQQPMPVVTHHSELQTVKDGITAILKRKKNMSDERREQIIQSIVTDIPLDAKPVDIDIYTRRTPASDHRIVSWVRAQGDLGEEQNSHRSVAAYISDWSLLWAGVSSDPSIKISMMASLDHSMWFHKPFKMNEWILYEVVATRMASGRPLCQGRMWTEDGELVATVAQEGIARGKL